MNVEKMWSWEDWKQNGKNLPDLSYQGTWCHYSFLIPLECPGISRSRRPCKTKLCDGLPNYKNKTVAVGCSFCGFKGDRVMGIMNEKFPKNIGGQ